MLKCVLIADFERIQYNIQHICVLLLFILLSSFFTEAIDANGLIWKTRYLKKVFLFNIVCFFQKTAVLLKTYLFGPLKAAGKCTTKYGTTKWTGK